MATAEPTQDTGVQPDNPTTSKEASHMSKAQGQFNEDDSINQHLS